MLLCRLRDQVGADDDVRGGDGVGASQGRDEVGEGAVLRLRHAGIGRLVEFKKILIYNL